MIDQIVRDGVPGGRPGAVYAYYDRHDSWHDAARELLDQEAGALVIPAVVIPEVDHLLGARIGHPAQLGFYDDIVSGVHLVEGLDVARYGTAGCSS